ncbi:MAG: hypothetical protein IKT63_03665 [Oscillospiraceae bacterium]|nr:hypothetical protein [Oscillospiraceae bacterium]
MKISDYEMNQYSVKSAPDTLKAEGNVTPRDIKHIFDRLPEFIAQKFNAFVDYVAANFYTKEQAEMAISERVTAIGSADMQKSVYDSDNDGVVDRAMSAAQADNADMLNGCSADNYVTKTQLKNIEDQKADAEHIQPASTVTAGTFAGDVAACSTNRDTSCLRNTEVRITDTAGGLQLTNKIIMVRK